MKKIFILFCLISSLFASSFEDDLAKKVFDDFKASGTIVLYDGKDFLGHNKTRAYKDFTPASTFKIFNSLIALESKTLSSVDEVFYKYDGSKVYLPTWAKDSNLRYAIKVSQVPAYKYLAIKIGLENMQKYLNKLHYGNMQIGKEIDNFWLNDELKISAINQAELLYKLALNSLDFDKTNQEKVKEIMLLESGKNYKLYGKTGLNHGIGWFVGFVVSGDKVYSFALNMDCDSSKLKDREDIAKEYLKAKKLI